MYLGGRCGTVEEPCNTSEQRAPLMGIAVLMLMKVGKGAPNRQHQEGGRRHWLNQVASGGLSHNEIGDSVTQGRVLRHFDVPVLGYYVGRWPRTSFSRSDVKN